MRWTLFCLLCMSSVFLIRWIHVDSEGPWSFAQSLPFSTERVVPAGVLFEFFLAALVALAVYALISIRRWRLEAPEIPVKPTLPRDRVRVGLCRLVALLLTTLVAYWAGSHMDCGLGFRQLFVEVLGLPLGQLPNAAAAGTLATLLATLVASIYLFFGNPRPTSSQPMVYGPPVQMPPVQPRPPIFPQLPRRP